MKIAVLGAGGFLGKYLSATLNVTHTVIPVTRDTLDLLDFYQVTQWLANTGPDVIINCVSSSGSTRVDDINYSDVQKDLAIFLNFFNSTQDFRFINIGSGAEFDRRQPIHMAKESDIFRCRPLESYGFAKNIISRLCLEKNNFYTLRLFGCFNNQEPESRLFKRFLNDKIDIINNKWFDYITIEDFAIIVEHYCAIEQPTHQDINCVYQDKFLISDILELLVKTHQLNKQIQVNSSTSSTWAYYTGDGTKLAGLNLALGGLEEGIRNYV